MSLSDQAYREALAQLDVANSLLQEASDALSIAYAYGGRVFVDKATARTLSAKISTYLKDGR